MSITNPVADMLTQIRNALNVNFDYVSFQYSNIKHEIVKILVKEGYLTGYEIVNNDLMKKKLKVELKYDVKGIPIIDTIRCVSKPSKRVYTKKKDIYKVLNGFGTLILSTPKGLLTGKDARLKNVGGEVLVEVY